MSKNVVEPERPQTIWRMRVACWISKATRAKVHACARVSTRMRAHTHTHTKQSFRERTSVLYLHCLSCEVIGRSPVDWSYVYIPREVKLCGRAYLNFLFGAKKLADITCHSSGPSSVPGRRLRHLWLTEWLSDGTSVFPCLWHSTNLPHSFILLPPTLQNLRN
jgi:hypothetical protein